MSVNTLNFNETQVGFDQQQTANNIAVTARVVGQEQQTGYSKIDLAKLFILFGAVVLSFMVLYGLMQKAMDPHTGRGAVKEQPAQVVSPDTLMFVERAIRHSLRSGDWSYQSTVAVNGGVHFNLKPAKPIDKLVSAKANYIEQTLCPKSNSYLWRFIQPGQITFHLLGSNQQVPYSASCKDW